ncbi:MAG: histidine phosphatase family protein [Planctomycetes bacterium]|nr:histidine phosphatase family protein [Planctomycetota bacterium]
MKRSLSALLLLGVAPLLASTGARPRSEEASAPPAPRTVLLVRHAEKETAPADPRDPSLSTLGAARAAELARVLAPARATRLFTSELARTRETLGPLSEALGIAPEPLPAAQPAATLAALDALPPGAVAVVCGHSNTVPRIASLLGVELAGLVEERGARLLPDEAYDRLYVVTRPASGPPSVVELRYGGPSGATASSGR